MADSAIIEESDAPTELKHIKPVRLSLHLIVKRHLPDEASQWSQERIITELNKLRRVRLDRENIGQIDSMELLSSEVTNLYLQSNQIKCIENLECLPNLQVVVLSRNQISSIEGIFHLQKLVFLDLSENNITDVEPGTFPKSIVILNLKDNPCAIQDGHREYIKKLLPKLKQLNGADLIDEDMDSDQHDYSDYDDDDDENDEIVDNDNGIESHRSMDSMSGGDRLAMGGADSNVSAPISLRSNYKQLPTIQGSITDITTEMLMRSQNRLEEVGMVHKRHVQEMTNIKIKSKIRPLPSISKPS